ncbi:MAG: GTP cyclohydrolase I FolE2 [Phycisphaeraceae bacterium]|nr:GTP cyclohydrolase I FolE2 [Phycisphaeraceae bacterium]
MQGSVPPASPESSSAVHAAPSHGAVSVMPDVQASHDLRRVAIDKVGVRNIRYPITLHCPATGGVVHTVATVNMYVGLPHHQKGTHMSRFLEVLNEHHVSLRSNHMMKVCHDIKDRLEAEEAHLELTFAYFVRKKAPVTGSEGMLDLQVTFECSANDHDDFVMAVKVPAASLCPCSKEISAYGAHNQRCEIEAKVRFEPGKFMWIEELFETIEKSASVPVFSVLKRPDEKWVTETAYDNPKFVEDIVRDLAVALDKEPRIAWYQVISENFESIHNHNAYALVEKDKHRDHEPRA